MNMTQAFEGEWEFLSNFYPANVDFGYIAFPTVEHAYQAAKTTEYAPRKRIQMCATPGRAKRLGQTVTLRANWDDIKVGIMWDLLRQKFDHTGLMSSLIATRPQELVEWNTWHDNVWGKCVCYRCNGEGQNLLGKLLMAVREEV